MFSKSLTSMEMGQYLFRLHIDPYLSFWLHIVFYIYYYLSILVKLGFLLGGKCPCGVIWYYLETFTSSCGGELVMMVVVLLLLVVMVVVVLVLVVVVLVLVVLVPNLFLKCLGFYSVPV